MAGSQLLERLRVTGRRRQPVDPELVSRLRFGLETGLTGTAAGAGGCLAAPVTVTKDRLTGALACSEHRPLSEFSGSAPTMAMACGALIAVLFRQLVTVGRIDDPIADGMAGLSVDDHHRPLTSWIGALPAAEKAELRAELTRQAEGMQRRWPPLEPGWLPRTREAMRIPMLGGEIELSARVDLVVGRPAVAEASVAIVDVKSGARQVEHRDDLFYYALVEALRAGAPPFVAATYYTRTGELDVEPVTAPILFGAVHRTVAGARLLRDRARGIESTRPSPARCARCAGLAGAEEHVEAMATRRSSRRPSVRRAGGARSNPAPAPTAPTPAAATDGTAAATDRSAA